MKYKVTLNNKTYEVEVERGEAILVDEYEAAAPAPAPSAPTPQQSAPAPVPAPAAPSAVSASGDIIASPMPGTILKINISQGQSVKKGEILIVLEAMKMENEILAPRDGVIAQVVTSKGSQVDTGEALVVLA